MSCWSSSLVMGKVGTAFSGDIRNCLESLGVGVIRSWSVPDRIRSESSGVVRSRPESTGVARNRLVLVGGRSRPSLAPDDFQEFLPGWLRFRITPTLSGTIGSHFSGVRNELTIVGIGWTWTPDDSGQLWMIPIPSGTIGSHFARVGNVLTIVGIELDYRRLRTIPDDSYPDDYDSGWLRLGLEQMVPILPEPQTDLQ